MTGRPTSGRAAAHPALDDRRLPGTSPRSEAAITRPTRHRLLAAAAAGGLLAAGTALAACSRQHSAGQPPEPSEPSATGSPRTGRAADVDGMRMWRDLAYAPVSRAQRLDLYRPADLPTAPTAPSPAPLPLPLPVVLTIHGGAFAVGDKREDRPIVRTLVRAGYAVASLNYRMSGEAAFPAAVQDVKAAVRWLRTHAAAYGLDPDRIAAAGASAGAYLAVMLGATRDVPMFDDPALGNPGVSSAVQAVVDFFGPVDFSTMDAHARANERCTAADARHDRPTSPESRFLGRPVGRSPDLVRVASPLSYLTRGALPPFLIEHGDGDCVVPHRQSLQLADALRAAGAPAVELTIVPGAGHGSDFPTDERMGAVLDFLRRALGG